MKHPKPLTDEDGEVRELTDADFARMQPLETFDPKLYAKLTGARGKRGPQKTRTKEMLTIRLSPEVTKYFRATGKGWQSRIDQVLKDYVSSHPQG